MSGLTPIKSQDAILGLPDASDPERYMMLSAEERADAHATAARGLQEA